jgi:pimeloyl-ACP methyl ester carboxylesterase
VSLARELAVDGTESRTREHWIPVGPDRRDRAWVYDVAGPTPDAPALLLVHGLGVTAHLTWQPSYAALAEHFRVVTLDLPGHGRGLRTGFSLERCADDLIEVIEALCVSRAVVVGYSLGGTIAQLTWRRHRSRIAGLVLAATTSEFARDCRTRALLLLLPFAAAFVHARPDLVHRQLVERSLERVGGWIAHDVVRRELAGHHPPTLLQAARAAGAFTSRDWLGSIDVPTAVIVVAHDDRIPPAHQRELAAAIPGASVYEVPGPHTACITSAAAFVPDLLRACQEVWSRASEPRKR